MSALFKTKKPVIGMLHLPALPGSRLYGGSISAIRDLLLRDADALAEGGVHGLMMENFGDVPFYPGCVPTHVAAHMTALAVEVRRRVDLPLGINVLRNDGVTALAVAHAAGGSFIRVNVLCGARVTDQGVIQGIAHNLLREDWDREVRKIQIFADVDVKHSAALASRPIADEVEDTIHRGLADALIVSGWGTGKPTDPKKAKAVKAAAGNTAVFVGSGVSAKTVAGLLDHADGFIVGSAFKQAGLASNPVETKRVKEFMARFR
jgi:membrane complex biogenesis BtpA family protein